MQRLTPSALDAVKPLRSAGLFLPFTSAIPIVLVPQSGGGRCKDAISELPADSHWLCAPRLQRNDGSPQGQSEVVLMIYRLQRAASEGFSCPARPKGFVVELLSAGMLGADAETLEIAELERHLKDRTLAQRRLWRLGPTSEDGLGCQLRDFDGRPLLVGSFPFSPSDSLPTTLHFKTVVGLPRTSPVLLHVLAEDELEYSPSAELLCELVAFRTTYSSSSSSSSSSDEETSLDNCSSLSAFASADPAILPLPAPAEGGKVRGFDLGVELLSSFVEELQCGSGDSSEGTALFKRRVPMDPPKKQQLIPIVIGWTSPGVGRFSIDSSPLVIVESSAAASTSHETDAISVLIGWFDTPSGGRPCPFKTTAAVDLFDAIALIPTMLRDSEGGWSGVVPVWVQTCSDITSPQFDRMPLGIHRNSYSAPESVLTTVYRSAVVDELLWSLRPFLSYSKGGPEWDRGDDCLYAVYEAALEQLSQFVSSVVSPLIERLRRKLLNRDGAASEGTYLMEHTTTGLYWTSSFMGHYTFVQLLWKHCCNHRGRWPVVLCALEQSGVRNRLEDLAALVHLADETDRAGEEGGQRGSQALQTMSSRSFAWSLSFRPPHYRLAIDPMRWSPLHLPLALKQWPGWGPDIVLELAHPLPTELGTFEKMVSDWFASPTGPSDSLGCGAWAVVFRSVSQSSQRPPLVNAVHPRSLMPSRLAQQYWQRPPAPVVQVNCRRYATSRDLRDWRIAALLSAWIYDLDSHLRSVLESAYGVFFESLPAKVQRSGSRVLDSRNPNNFFTILQGNRMQWAALPRYESASGNAAVHVVLRGTDGFLDCIRDLIASSGTLHVIQGSETGCVAVVNEWYVPVRIELEALKDAIAQCVRSINLLHRLGGSSEDAKTTLQISGHGLGGAFASILGWLLALDAPEFSRTNLLNLGIVDFEVITFGQPPVVSQPSLDFVKEMNPALFDSMSNRTTRIVRPSDPVPRPSSSAEDLLPLMSSGEWHGKMQVAQQNLNMFGHFGHFGLLGSDWDDQLQSSAMRVMLVDAGSCRITANSGARETDWAGEISRMFSRPVLSTKAYVDHSPYVYLFEMACARAGSHHQGVTPDVQESSASLERLLAP
eukprot:NODE_76_length_3469_cov_19.953509_g68_i0.p1 GENE.NODE_76_length_3469_cov_19.953509_g68_i0~~NODE_76_length_3469_cov_19.953509_g68_i0.p1  ORF type:complete len:1108 (-),score=179.71 NODE_76_length_3469_cov_19.953509_g68_i0:51-3374(-)